MMLRLETKKKTVDNRGTRREEDQAKKQKAALHMVKGGITLVIFTM